MRSDYWHSFFVVLLSSTLGVFLFTVNQQLLLRERSARNGLMAVAYLDASLPDADAAKWSETLRAELPGVTQMEFISKADALKMAQADPSLSKALVMLKDNPLPATLTIRFSDEAWLQNADPADGLRAHSEVSEVRWNPALRDALREAKNWRHRTSQAAWGLGIIFGIWIMGACRFGQFRLKRRDES